MATVKDLIANIESLFGVDQDVASLPAPHLSEDDAGTSPGASKPALDTATRQPAALDALAKEGTKFTGFIRLLWVGSDGMRRCRVIPAARWESTKLHGLGLGPACMIILPHAPEVADGGGIGACGEIRLIPEDGAVPLPLPWRPRHAVVLASLHTRPGTPWACCPRYALRRTLRQLEAAHGLRLQVGFETEFVLLERRGGDPFAALQPASSGQYGQSSTFDAVSPVLDAMCDVLEAMGVHVQQVHGEAAAGQFEIVTGHTTAMEAVEQLLLTREAIQGVASEHGKTATFLPKLRQHEVGNGAHCHWSLQTVDGASLTSDETGPHGLTRPAAQFMAGVLAHLPALLPFLLASPNSYRRAVPASFSGAHRVWGVQNKEAALRLCTMPGTPEATNIELKTLDACANPYIALAAVVTAGMAGITAGTPLPEPINLDPSTLSAERAAELGVERLPTSLTEALEALFRDAELCEALKDTLGAPLLRAYLATKVAEESALATRGLDEQVAALQHCY